MILVLLCDIKTNNIFSIKLLIVEFVIGTEMAQLVCGGCHTLLMYIRGATSVQCSCCHTVNLALEGEKTITTKTSIVELDY